MSICWRPSAFFAALLVSLIFRATSAFGFAEMVRHGYVNCTTCHVASNGGGILTSYGRALSAEVLSTWGTENEVKFAYGVLPMPEWLNLGGDFRFLQQYSDTPRAEQMRFIWMQGDVEAAANYKDLSAVATLGRQPFPDTTKVFDQVTSRRHYLLYRATDKVALRAGRFFPAFGINTPEHYLFIKQGLGFDEGMETYNFEAAFLGDSWDGFATAIFGRPGSGNQLERGGALRASFSLEDKMKIGASYYYGLNQNGHRHFGGPYALLGLTPRFFILAESDFQYAIPYNAPGAWGVVNYLKVDREWVQGFHTFLTGEFARLNFKDPSTVMTEYGVGVQFFPRPHFEFLLTYQKRRDLSKYSDYYDYAYLLMHYYL